VALHVVEHGAEVGQRLVQRGHVGHARGLDLEALGAALEHAFIDAAQVVVVALAARLLQPRELALDLGGGKHVAYLRHRQAQNGGWGNKALFLHHVLLWQTMRLFKHKTCPCCRPGKPYIRKTAQGGR
jgi:hypothetical protein